jgi:2-polyprenyl-3-methyl-5-hydroxy-6-metoxy-1,4-benzoquinol methylase
MAAKLAAIPIPAELAGLSVLDIGCDHGAFSKLASDRGAAHVLGLDRGRGVRQGGRTVKVDLVERNRALGWERCAFEHFNLGAEWTEFGRFDLVFFFSVYHHVYSITGEHPPIWAWLAKHVAPGGTLLFEGPVDTRDATAAERARPHGGYTRDRIHAAASAHFEVEHIGPALHRAHREVWRCRP